MDVNTETPKSSGNEGQSDFFIREQGYVHVFVSFIAVITVRVATASLRFAFAFVIFGMIGAIIGFQVLCIDPHTMTPTMLGLLVLFVSWDLSGILLCQDIPKKIALQMAPGNKMES